MGRFVKSGMANLYRITYIDRDEAEVVQAIPGDAMAWERSNKGQQFQNAVGVSSIMWVAWRALRREGRNQETNFEKWADTVADFEVENDEDEDEGQGADDPTLPDQSDT